MNMGVSDKNKSKSFVTLPREVFGVADMNGYRFYLVAGVLRTGVISLRSDEKLPKKSLDGGLTSSFQHLESSRKV